MATLGQDILPYLGVAINFGFHKSIFVLTRNA